MRRRVFEQVSVEGLESSQVEALSFQVGHQSRRLCAGTSDGQLTVYDVLSSHRGSGSMSVGASSKLRLSVAEVLRQGSARDRKSVTQVEILESVIVALIDGVPTVYDAQTLRATATAREVRGCQLFCAHVPSRTLVFFAKKKARVFGWHRGGALRDTRREYALAESATAACCVSEKAVVFATRRDYMAFRLFTEQTTPTLTGGPTTSSGGIFRTTMGSALSSLGGNKSSGESHSAGKQAAALASSSVDTAVGIGGGGPASSSSESATRRLCEASGGAGVAVIVAGSQSRPNAPRLLTSSGTRGVLFDAAALSSSALEDRLTWSAAPTQSRAVSAFVVSLVGANSKRCEIHFAPSLALVQTIDFDFRPAALCGGSSSLFLKQPSGGDFASAQQGAQTKFAFGETSNNEPLDDQLFVVDSGLNCRCLKMVPARTQISALVDDGSYEDALALCDAWEIQQDQRIQMSSAGAGGPSSASSTGFFASPGASYHHQPIVDVAAIEERYAYALYSRGDFEGAVQHWLAADTSPVNVAALFPALCPPGLVQSNNLLARGGASAENDEDASPEKKEALRHPPQLRQASLSRAAAAVTRYLEETRNRLLHTNEGTSRSASSSSASRPARKSTTAVRPGDDAALAESLKLVDTVLVAARLHCSPPRVADVVALLKSPDQRCELESVAPLLAAGGPAYAEPLLWLYRSKGQHSRALSMLVEERCCGPDKANDASGTISTATNSAQSSDTSTSEGTWDRQRFRRWKARYLRSLWFSGDPRLAALALDAAGSLFDVAPALGLAVFTGAKVDASSDPDEEREQLRLLQERTHRSAASGGAGTPPQDVVAWMKKLTFPAPQQNSSSPGGSEKAGTVVGDDEDELPPLVLDSGNTVAVAYLEFLVSRGERLELLHNELAYLLLDGLLKTRGESTSSESHKRDEAYRSRLRRFLKGSDKYRAETVLSWIPDDLPRERALVLARLGRHDDVLTVYADELRDDALAEAYCAEVWEAADAAKLRRLALGESGRRGDEDDDEDDLSPGRTAAMAAADEEDDDEALGVYLCLARRYVRQETDAGLDKAMSVVSKNARRVDPVAALELLPDGVSFAKVSEFAANLYRLTESARREAEIEHQLLRVHYVDLKYELTQRQLRQQSKISAVPELARLGKLKRSLQPVVLSEPGNAEPYDVTCVPHVFEGHVALQFRVTNNAQGYRMQNVRVKVESLGDADLYAHDAEVPLKVLPFKFTGSCYVVFRTFPTVGTVVTSFANELRFAVLADSSSRASSSAAATLSRARAGSSESFDAASGPNSSYLEEIPLHNLELSTADM